MSWRNLLQREGESVIAPWLGGRALRLGVRKWLVSGTLPQEHGWYVWGIEGRKAKVVSSAFEPWDGCGPVYADVGFLVGDLLVSTQCYAGQDINEENFPRVHLLPTEELDHFSFIRAGAAWVDGPLLFVQEEFPLGSEDEVRNRYLDDADNLDGVAGVPPGLHVAFDMLVQRRKQEERRREAIRAAREREERLRSIREQLGDGAIRRVLAREDFHEAARAALAVGGGDFIEARPSSNDREYVVRYRVDGRRYECVCDDTLHIVDAGICLTDEHTGEKGDTYFTLESLPGVTRAAMEAGAAIWRHV